MVVCQIDYEERSMIGLAKGANAMHIDVPEELISRLRERAACAPGASEADVIREALDSLDWRDAERVAIQAGLDAIRAGRVRSFEEFDAEFCRTNGIGADA
jgi:predicted transcriptional regulator